MFIFDVSIDERMRQKNTLVTTNTNTNKHLRGLRGAPLIDQRSLKQYFYKERNLKTIPETITETKPGTKPETKPNTKRQRNVFHLIYYGQISLAFCVWFRSRVVLCVRYKFSLQVSVGRRGRGRPPGGPGGPGDPPIYNCHPPGPLAPD